MGSTRANQSIQVESTTSKMAMSFANRFAALDESYAPAPAPVRKTPSPPAPQSHIQKKSLTSPPASAPARYVPPGRKAHAAQSPVIDIKSHAQFPTLGNSPAPAKKSWGAPKDVAFAGLAKQWAEKDDDDKKRDMAERERERILAEKNLIERNGYVCMSRTFTGIARSANDITDTIADEYGDDLDRDAYGSMNHIRESKAGEWEEDCDDYYSDAE